MHSIQETIAHEFSRGNFSFAFGHFSETIKWKVVGGQTTRGKQAVIDSCTAMQQLMNGSSLHNTNCIVTGEQIAVEGFCNYVDGNNKQCVLEYCDLFQFTAEQLTSITSYAIETKLVL